MDARIKQLATDLQKAEHWDFDEESVHFILDREKTAKRLCKMGYSKRSEGEWKKVAEKYPRYACTSCNHLYNNKEYKYCPNCGAKMKGGE